MREIRNELFSVDSIRENDLFICAFGYEPRSVYLYDKVRGRIKAGNILVLYFDDYNCSEKIEELRDQKVKCVEATYNSEQFVQNEVCKFVEEKVEDTQRRNIHIDYSSMPRNWYYNLPILLDKENLKMNFWYVVGKYPIDYKAYPTAGIDRYTIIGKPSLSTEGKRLHVFGLSYDFVRTKALISELDPDCYITCNAFDEKNLDREGNVNSLNQQIISKAINELSFQFDDFSFMFSKFCELANEYSTRGSVIFVPDGPKPLIFAMSLATLCLDKEGVSCLHIYRNELCKTCVNVEPTDVILGFSI